MHYCDHNATSPLRPESLAAMTHALSLCGNPSSIHAAGRAARTVAEKAREEVAALLGARAEEVIFTSGSTEANSLALWGAVRGALDAEARITRLFVSAVEHSSVLATVADIAARVSGVRVETIPVTADGVVDTKALHAQLRDGKGRALVAVMAANNETGVIQPIEEVSRLTREAGALLLVDVVAAAGKDDLYFSLCDYMTISAHKIGGPQGVGALAVADSAPLAPQILGGGQQKGRRAGTENLSGIAGFGAAAYAALHDRDERARIGALRDGFEAALKNLAPDAVIFGAAVPRLCSTSNFAIPGVTAENALLALDLDGVMVSSGSTCSSGKVTVSHVLHAMGVAETLAAGALRVSFGWNSGVADSEAVIASLSNLLSRVRAYAA
jgi:cysteine desulfurase